MQFQNKVNIKLAAAIPGTLVEAGDTYKYLVKGIVDGGPAYVGKFAAKEADGKYRGLKQDDTAADVVGVVILNNYVSSDDTATNYYGVGQSVAIAQNGVIAVEAYDKGDSDVITVNLDNNDIYIGTTPGTVTNKLEITSWKVVQHTGLDSDTEKGIAFIKG